MNSDIVRTLFIQVYSNIFSIIKAYSHILRHLRHIQYPVQLLHIHNLAIFPALEFRTGEPGAYSKPCETVAKYMQNPDIVRTMYASIIQPYWGIFRTLYNTCICRSLAYSESGIFKALP